MKKAFKGYFQVMDFSLTHKMLLIRKTDIVDEEPYNTDISFAGVFYIEITTVYDDLHISFGNEEDVKDISSRCDEDYIGDISTTNIFILESNGKRYRVGAAQMDIQNNTLYPPETSLGPKRKS